MNNYTGIQKILHRLSLAPGFIRQLTFDFEKQIFLEPETSSDTDHIFVAGMARAGTTILLRALYETDLYASLTYDDMPFILAPNLWHRVRGSKRSRESTTVSERAHGDGILVGTNSPEAFEEVFWNTADQDEASVEFVNYITLILKKYEKTRYLSKNNQNIKRIDLIKDIFPQSYILIPFRDPIQHAYSLLNQHKRFCEAQKADSFIKNYMDWIGHSEFGESYIPLIGESLSYSDPSTLNHWLEQWILVYSKILDSFADQDNIHFICYESLCNDRRYWEHILKSVNNPVRLDFDFSLSQKDVQISWQHELKLSAQHVYEKMRETSSFIS